MRYWMIAACLLIATAGLLGCVGDEHHPDTAGIVDGGTTDTSAVDGLTDTTKDTEQPDVLDATTDTGGETVPPDVMHTDTDTDASDAIAVDSIDAEVEQDALLDTQSDPGAEVGDDGPGKDIPTDDAVADVLQDTEPDLSGPDADDATAETDTGFDPNGTDGTFYCVGYGGLFMRSSDLGLTWDVLEDQGSGGDDPSLYRNIHYLNGVFFRVGNGGRGFWVSTDGAQTWTDHNESDALTSNWIGGVAYGNGRWVAAGGCGVTITSLDAVNWTGLYNAPGQPGCEHARTIAFGGGTFVTLGNNGGAAYSATTVDGTNFANYQETSDYGWHTVEYAFGKFWVSRSDGSAVMTSTDGVSWSAQTGIPNTGYRWLSHWAGRLLIPTTDGVLLESTDGISFTSMPAPTLNRVAYGGGVYLGSGGNGTLRRSADSGQTWTNVNPTTHSVQRCIYAP